MGSSEPKLRLNSLPKRVRKTATEIAETPPVQKLATVPFEWEEAPGKPRPTAPKSKAVRSLQLPPAATGISQVSPTSVLDDPLDHHYSISSSGLTLTRSRSLSSTASLRSKKVVESDGRVKIIRISRKSSFFSLSSYSSFSSHFLSNVYESCKQVVPWRRRRHNP